MARGRKEAVNSEEANALLQTRQSDDGKPARHRDADVLERNMALVMDIKLRHPSFTHPQIMAEYIRITGTHINRQTVSRYLADIRRQWAEQRSDDYNTLINMELRRLDIMEQEAWDAWDRSMQADFEEEFIELVNPGDYNAVREMAREVSRAVAREVVGLGGPPVDRYAVEDTVMGNVPPTTFQALVHAIGKEGDAAKAVEEEGGAEKLVTSRVTRMLRKGPGNDRFLRLVLDVQKERRKVLGAYSPELRKVQVDASVRVKGYAGYWSPDTWDHEIEGEVGEEPVLLEAGAQVGVAITRDEIAEEVFSAALGDSREEERW